MLQGQRPALQDPARRAPSASAITSVPAPAPSSPLPTPTSQAGAFEATGLMNGQGDMWFDAWGKECKKAEFVCIIYSEEQ